MKLYISDSENSLEIPATQTYYFINFEMTTKLSVLKFISSIKNIIAVGLPGLLWELRLRSRDANCFVIAPDNISVMYALRTYLYWYIGYNAEEEGQK